MKYIIILAVSFLFGCDFKPIPIEYEVPIEMAQIGYIENETYKGNIIRLVIIDSCEYVIYCEGFSRGAAGGITHKGNCKFCEQRKCK